MKVATFALTAATAVTVVLAQPHQHHNRHAHKPKRDTVTSYVPAATATVFELNSSIIPMGEVCSGIADGDLKWANGGASPDMCSSTSTTSAWSSSTSASASSSGAGEFYQQPSWSASSSQTSAATTTWASSSAAEATSAWTSSAAAAATSAVSGGSGIGSTFPDGQISCSTFPSDYGAVYIDYLNLGGWTGLQSVTISGSMVSNIVTGISGDTCTEGMMCSYACPPGYQKSQWPSTQGATGQSVGGLSCSGGKLYLTNSGLSSSLCIEGVGGVQATNNAGSVVSICRTDYPGTESETIPTVLEAGQSQPLTVPDASNYYVWEGKSTSAQYYLNPPGYGASDACQWGSPGNDVGNYAPINFGVGAKDGTTWLSIMSNTPTTTATYPGTVEITGNISGSCKYENGQYCSASGCNSAGCTVSLVSGTATYVIT